MLREMGLPNRKKIALSALLLIPNLRDQGLSADEIANAVGCTVGTLRVKWSHIDLYAAVSIAARSPKRLPNREDRPLPGGQSTKRRLAWTLDAHSIVPHRASVLGTA